MSESKFPLVLKLGLDLIARNPLGNPEPMYVKASDLESILAQAPVVWRGKGQTWPEDWSPSMPEQNRQLSARLLMIEPLAKPKVKKSEIKYELGTRAMNETEGSLRMKYEDLLRRILEQWEGE